MHIQYMHTHPYTCAYTNQTHTYAQTHAHSPMPHLHTCTLYTHQIHTSIHIYHTPIHAHTLNLPHTHGTIRTHGHTYTKETKMVNHTCIAHTYTCLYHTHLTGTRKFKYTPLA
ncbi:unnamed protein product [Meganyctiphanes norvegica]|uniref:Uncharacterized protein n=1 Tax=Meganyctiphanes norvegica TaxID=48144 RepID=A0AAV2SVD2_MEGNR